MSKLTIMLVAFFIGNETPMKDVYIFQQPIYESYKACLKEIDEHYDVLNYFLSQEFGHTAQLYHNQFYCTTDDEVRKLIEGAKKSDVSV